LDKRLQSPLGAADEELLPFQLAAAVDAAS
jgi:hypothetical protein